MKIPQIVNFRLICLIREIWTILRRQAAQRIGCNWASMAFPRSSLDWDLLGSTWQQLRPNYPRKSCFACPALWPPDLLCSLTMQRTIRRPDPGEDGRSEPSGFAFRMLLAYRCDACLCWSSKLLGEEDAASLLFTIIPRPGLPMGVLECLHTQERTF